MLEASLIAYFAVSTVFTVVTILRRRLLRKEFASLVYKVPLWIEIFSISIFWLVSPVVLVYAVLIELARAFKSELG